MKKRKSVLALAIVSGVLLVAAIACILVAIVLAGDFAEGIKALGEGFIANLSGAEGEMVPMILTIGCIAVGAIIAIVWIIIDAMRKKGIVALFAIMAILAGGLAGLESGMLLVFDLNSFNGELYNILGLAGIICSILSLVAIIVLFVVDLVSGKVKKDTMQIAEESAAKKAAKEAEELAVEEEKEEVEETPAEEPVEEEKAEEVKEEPKVEESAPVEKEPVVEDEKVEAAEVKEPVVEEKKEEPKKAEKKETKKAKPAKAEKKESKKEEPKAKEVKKEEKPAPKAKEEKPAKVKEEKVAPKAKEEKKPAAKKDAEKVEEPKAEPAKAEKKEKDGPTKVYHVSKRAADEKWVIKFAGGEKVIKTFRTKVEACEYADKLAASQGGIVLVHASKGKNAGRINEKR